MSTPAAYKILRKGKFFAVLTDEGDVAINLKATSGKGEKKQRSFAKLSIEEAARMAMGLHIAFELRLKGEVKDRMVIYDRGFKGGPTRVELSMDEKGFFFRVGDVSTALSEQEAAMLYYILDNLVRELAKKLPEVYAKWAEERFGEEEEREEEEGGEEEGRGGRRYYRRR